MKFRIASLASIALLLSPVSVFSQNSAHQLDEIIVSASQHNKTESEIAGSLNLISGDDLKREAASTLGETLKNQIGVNSSSFGPGVGVPVIRGQSGRRVEVLQNNTVVADVSDTSADHAVAAESFLADRIEILRGPATLRYGAGAIGGVVNVIDNRIHDRFEEGINGGIRASFDENTNERAIIGKLDAGINNWMFHVDAVVRENNNVEIPGFANAEADDPDETTDGFIANTDGEADSYSFGVSHIGSNLTAGLSVNRTENDYGIPPGAHAEEEGGEEEEEEEEEETVRIDLTQTQYQGQLTYSNLGDFFDHLDVNVSYSNYDHQEIEFEGDEAFIGTLFSADTLEARAELAHRAFQNWIGTLGFQYSDRDFAAVGDEAFVPRSDTTRSGIYLIEETNLGAGTIEFGLRFDAQSISSDGIDDIDHNTLNFSLGYLLPFSENQRFSAILSRSERAPAAEELLSDGEHVATATFEVGDQTLDDETAVSIEFTWALEQTEAGLSARASIFHNDFSSYISLLNTGLRFNEDLETPTSSGLDVCSDDIADFGGDQGSFDGALDCFLYVEEGATFTGLEAELTYAINDRNSIRLWGDLVRARLEDNGDVPRTPPGRVGATWEHQTGGWTGRLSLTNGFDQDRAGQGEEETESYLRVDTFVGWDAENYSVFLKGSNLFNEEIRNSTSFLRELAPEPGRAFSIGATYAF